MASKTLVLKTTKVSYLNHKTGATIRDFCLKQVKLLLHHSAVFASDLFLWQPFHHAVITKNLDFAAYQPLNPGSFYCVVDICVGII